MAEPTPRETARQIAERQCYTCHGTGRIEVKAGAYWASPEGRADIRETWTDYSDGNAVLPLLDTLEASEAHVATLTADLAQARQERDDALQALDVNWVTHQRVVAAEHDKAARTALLEAAVDLENEGGGLEGWARYAAKWLETRAKAMTGAQADSATGGART